MLGKQRTERKGEGERERKRKWHREMKIFLERHNKVFCCCCCVFLYNIGIIFSNRHSTPIFFKFISHFIYSKLNVCFPKKYYSSAKIPLYSLHLSLSVFFSVCLSLSLFDYLFGFCLSLSVSLSLPVSLLSSFSLLNNSDAAFYWFFVRKNVFAKITD